MNCNYYDSLTTKTAKKKDIFDIYIDICQGAYQIQTDFIQKKWEQSLMFGFDENEKSSYQADKKEKLPCVVFSGTFDRYKSIEDQIDSVHSGRMNMDIDLNNKVELEDFEKLVKSGKIPFIEACAKSVSGKFNGSMWINVLISIPETFDKISEFLVSKLNLTNENYILKLHTAYYDMFSDMLFRELKISAGSTKDVKRLRYLSHDSDIYINYDAKYLDLKMLEMWYNILPPDKMEEEINEQFIEENDLYKIALKYAENKVGKCITGNIHNYVLYFCIIANRMGIPEKDAKKFVEEKLKVNITTNCVEYPYKAYKNDFGTFKPKPRPISASGTNNATERKSETIENIYFRYLGFTKQSDNVQLFNFYVFGSKTILSLAASKLNKSNLYTLAPINYWQTNYPKKNGFDIDAAINHIIENSNRIGYFNPNKIRGRGAWIDKGRIVIHCGSHLLVDNNQFALGDIDTEYWYELQHPLNLTTANPLTKDESHKILETIQKLSWVRDVDCILLGGWVALAPICGVLNWRPHIWITGGAGSGKSWVNREILQKFTKDISISVQGNTSEAGLREFIGNDAINVLFDEAEGENEHAQIQIQKVLQLMRSASSSDGGVIAKGTGSGAKTYQIKSCFAFCSIVPQAIHNSDLRRITILELKKGKLNNENFIELEKEFRKFATDDFVKRFQSRIINLIPQILKTIEVFTNVITEKLSNRAMGDQLGALLGGCWHLSNDSIATVEDVMNLISEIDFSEEQGLNSVTDEMKCLQHILSIQIRVDTDHTGQHTRTVGELLEIQDECIYGESAIVNSKTAEKVLKRNGIKLEDDFIFINPDSSVLQGYLKNTSWTKNYGQILSRIKDAEKIKRTYYSTGIYAKAVKIPFKPILEKYSDI
jgi:putative DNA primase/helicase